MNTGLTPEDLKSIAEVVKQNKHVHDIILFGSRAKGNYTSGSDIDLAIKGEQLVLKDILDISIQLDELMLPYKFDLVLYARINEIALKEHIDRVGISLSGFSSSQNFAS